MEIFINQLKELARAKNSHVQNKRWKLPEAFSRLTRSRSYTFASATTTNPPHTELPQRANCDIFAALRGS